MLRQAFRLHRHWFLIAYEHTSSLILCSLCTGFLYRNFSHRLPRYSFCHELIAMMLLSIYLRHFHARDLVLSDSVRTLKFEACCGERHDSHFFVEQHIPIEPVECASQTSNCSPHLPLRELALRVLVAGFVVGEGYAEVLRLLRLS